MNLIKAPGFLIDPFIRYKAMIHETPLDTYRVRVASSVEEYEDAFGLVHVGYVFQGIERLRSRTRMRITPHHVLPESAILVAYEQDRIVGTMTVTLDSPAGLPLDHEYPTELEEVRRRSQGRLVEYGSLAVVRCCWNSGVTTLLNMAAHFLSLNVLKATHCVVGIHPKVVPFYRALYNFRPLGKPRWHTDLHAPMRGMVQDVPAGGPFVKKHFKRPLSSGLLFHEHCCDHLPQCVQLPPMRSFEELLRWKLPRDVFQELFIHRSDRLMTLPPRVRKHLKDWRSDHTMIPAPREQLEQCHA